MRVQTAVVVLGAIGLWGCHDAGDGDGGVSEDATTGNDTTAQDTFVSVDTTPVPDTLIVNDATTDTDASDTAVDTAADVPPETGAFGAPCNGNADCQSGWCVESPEGYICTKECLEECPEDFDCKSVQNSGGDVTFLCLPRVEKLCVPCLEDFNCNGGVCLTTAGQRLCGTLCGEGVTCPEGFSCRADETGEHSETYCQPNDGQCLPDIGTTCQPCESELDCAGGGAACVALDGGTFCTQPCSDSTPCNQGFTCTEVPESDLTQCLPNSNSCTCDGSNTDLSRACSETWTAPDPAQPSYTCTGIQQCAAEGWADCVLPDEECDGIDNNCDGVIDEPWRVDGKYTALAHCGGCGISCLVLALSNADPVCNADGAIPTCGYECTGDAVDVNGLSDDGCECVPQPGDDFAGDGVDSNCDGIDGDVNQGIFVAKDGSDSNPGTRELPVVTIAQGLALADTQSKRDVYVATGVYSERIALIGGIGLFGGYSSFFNQRDPLLFETAIFGGTPTQPDVATIRASGLGAAGQPATIVNGFTIFGTNAANIQGSNSYAVYLSGCGPTLRVESNQIFGGAGGNGSQGQAGTEGATGVDGGMGIGSFDTNGAATSCSASDHRQGGSGGQQMCGGTSVSGGNGGAADCPVYGNAPAAASGGASGSGASAGAGGAAGWDGYFCADEPGTFGGGTCGGGLFSCGSCYNPPGDNQRSGDLGGEGNGGPSGAKGQGCNMADGTVIGGHWRGVSGGDGGAGQPGSGGGGGGAGGGVDMVGSDCAALGSRDIGGTGGGGGSGGCPGTGGSSGAAGGGSFAIFLDGQLGGLPTLSGNTIQRGAGGAGGSGGPGGAGGGGGGGGAGGVEGDTYTGATYDRTWCASAGGEGGDGGDGGHGGGGGGGCGGASFGIFSSGGGGASFTAQNTFLPGGTGGVAGPGGASLDPVKRGGDGTTGTSANVNN